ncbi:MAG: fold metallo-hydrolase [Thermodesulfobacteriota bacterium]|nr:fold metallo-hydrolase [Thermodesulfobacteriota bacterium]
MALHILEHIKWLGHAGFSITAGGKNIFIDPYETGDCGKADIILITHSHYDHCSVPDINKIKTTSTLFVTEKDSAAALSGDVRVVKPGDKVSVSGIDIEAVPAYNTNKNFHPRKNNWLGFILTAGNIKIYHAGDTDLIPEMGSFAADIALLPVSGTYVMTAEEAVEAVKLIKPKIALPMNYGAIVGSKNDAMKFKNSLEGFCEVAIMERESCV